MQDKVTLIGDNLSIELNEKYLITDLDEVIVNISYRWYKKIRENWFIFEPYFKDLGDLTEIEVLHRTTYNLVDWLLKPEYDKLPDDIFNFFMSLYNTNNFYDEDLVEEGDLFTPFGKSIPLLAKKNIYEKIIIITRTTDETLKYKIAMFDKYFKRDDDKIIMYCVRGNTKKSDVIKAKKLKYTTFIDDNPNEVIDIIENTNSSFKEFILPELGYNNPKNHPKMMELVSKKLISFSSYKNVSSINKLIR